MGKTVCRKKVDGVLDQGIVYRRSMPGESYYFLDGTVLREPMLFRDGERFLLYCDAGGPELIFTLMLAESRDLVHWKKLGPAQGPSCLEHPGADYRDWADFLHTGSPWIFEEDGKYYMYTTTALGPRGQFMPLPYLCMVSVSDSMAGPWKKMNARPGCSKHICIPVRPGTWYSDTACAGSVIENPAWKGEKGRRYMMFFSSASYRGLPQEDPMSLARGVGIARTDDLLAGDDWDKTEGNFWTVDPEPVIPLEDDVENATVWHEEETGRWYMFVNHVHASNTYTDAVWVYWTDDPNHWDPENKAEVISSETCTWTHGAIGMPTVTRVGNRLAMVYDGSTAGNTSHLERDIALAWLDLPLKIVEK